MPNPGPQVVTAHNPEDPGRPWLDTRALQIAVVAAMAQRAALTERGLFTLSDLSRECGVSLPKLSGLLRHGDRPTARTLGLTLAWLRVDPSRFMVAGPEPEPIDVTAELLAS